MTEEEWEVHRGPKHIIKELEKQKILTSRKTRLFACSCYRLIWDQIHLASIKLFVELAEARADRQIKQTDLQKYRTPQGKPIRNSADEHLRFYAHEILQPRVNPSNIALTTRVAGELKKYNLDMLNEWEDCPEQANLLRDIFGNPFRSIDFDPTWRAATAVGLAQTMYDARNFHAMPILADALQDAGCEDATILGHCRDENNLHVRGCWVVDLILGKA